MKKRNKKGKRIHKKEKRVKGYNISIINIK